MRENLDLSVLDDIKPEAEAGLSPAWKRILVALRKLRDHLSPRSP